jgi:hypothetical protein
MYLGSEFHRYWARCGDLEKHPDDVPCLDETHFISGVRPCPFDGPLDQAKVIICLANPWYPEPRDSESLNKLILSMRSGEEPLPKTFDEFYQRIFGPIGISIERLRSVVAVFNVCPYASETMQAEAIRNASGLASVWQAQKYLREVLIPRAQTGNIYLILIRKLQLWGVTTHVANDGRLRVIPRHAINGVMPADLGEEINKWLINKFPLMS